MGRNHRKWQEKVEPFIHYYIDSPTWSAERLIRRVRSRRGIENGLHWVLNIAFQEDQHQLRKDHSRENFAVLRHIALNLLKQDTSVKAGIKAKRLKAGWDNDHLLKILAQ